MEVRVWLGVTYRVSSLPFTLSGTVVVRWRMIMGSAVLQPRLLQKKDWQSETSECNGAVDDSDTHWFHPGQDKGKERAS